MDYKEQMGRMRKEIDEVDRQLLPLFARRMAASEKIAQIKRENNMSIQDPIREQEVIDAAVSLVDESIRGEASLLMRSILALSREQQRKALFSEDYPLLPPPREPVRENVRCAYQGVPGAWSEQALMKLFPQAEKKVVEFFEDVFLAVKHKEADYGVVAIENSQSGAIGETYDLLRKYGCYIVGRTWIDIRQCLMALPGTRLEDIREVFSHPEGHRQCSGFLHGRAWDLTACRNTAVAARMVADSAGNRCAAIGSRRAAELNGLEVLAADIMDTTGNRTSFVVIAPEPEYDLSSDLISVTFSTAHRSGALCETLLPFMAQRINLMRIESRPSAPDKYRFFAELQGNILNGETAVALRQAAATCEYFEVIGCYSIT